YLTRDAGEELADCVDALVAAEPRPAVPDGVLCEERAHPHGVVSGVADVRVAPLQLADRLDRLQPCEPAFEIPVHARDHRMLGKRRNSWPGTRCPSSSRSLRPAPR